MARERERGIVILPNHLQSIHMKVDNFACLNDNPLLPLSFTSCLSSLQTLTLTCMRHLDEAEMVHVHQGFACLTNLHTLHVWFENKQYLAVCKKLLIMSNLKNLTRLSLFYYRIEDDSIEGLKEIHDATPHLHISLYSICTTHFESRQHKSLQRVTMHAYIGSMKY